MTQSIPYGYTTQVQQPIPTSLMTAPSVAAQRQSAASLLNSASPTNASSGNGLMAAAAPNPYTGGVPQGPQFQQHFSAPEPGGALGYGAGTYGQYGTVAAQNQMTPGGPVGNAPGGEDQWASRGPQISTSEEYGDYQNFGTTAQQYGALAGQALNNPQVQQSMGLLGGQVGTSNGQNVANQQQTQALNFLQGSAAGNAPGMSTLSQSAQGQGPGMAALAQNASGGGPGAMGLLAATANGGGPNPAAIQAQIGQQQAQAAALAQAASTRGGFGLANAQKQAMQTGAQLSQQNTQAAALAAAQQQLGAQQQYAQAQGQAQNTLLGAVGQAQGTYAGAIGQSQGQYGTLAAAQAAQQTAQAQQQNAAALAYAQTAQQQQNNLVNYGLGQQTAYQQQAQEAASLAEAQANIDLGQGAQNVQQTIANNQLTQNYVGMAAGGAGGLLTGISKL